MRKEVWIALLFFFNYFLTYSQGNALFGIKAGYNRSQLIGDSYKGYYKKGFNEGVFSQLPLTEKLNLQIELVVTNKGCSSSPSKSAAVNLNAYYLNRLYYIEFPILMQFHHKKFIFEFGPGLGLLIWQFDREPPSKKNYLSGTPSFTETSCNIGVGYKIKQRWTADLRYSNSIQPIRKFPTDQYNSVFSFALMYAVFERK